MSRLALPLIMTMERTILATTKAAAAPIPRRSSLLSGIV
jgi:hypothetical protein